MQQQEIVAYKFTKNYLYSKLYIFSMQLIIKLCFCDSLGTVLIRGSHPGVILWCLEMFFLLSWQWDCSQMSCGWRPWKPVSIPQCIEGTHSKDSAQCARGTMAEKPGPRLRQKRPKRLYQWTSYSAMVIFKLALIQSCKFVHQDHS